MAIDLKKFLDELNEILTDLKTHADKDGAWAKADKAKMFKRLDYLKDKSKDNSETVADRRDNIDADNDLQNLDTLIGADKTAWATEKSKLEKEKKDAETAKTQAESDKLKEVDKHNKTKQEVADKINADLVSGLTTLINTGLKKPKKKADGTDEKDSSGNIIYEDIFDKTLMDTIKTSVEEIKTKGAKADLSELKTQLDNIKAKTDTITESKGGDGKGGSNATQYWAIGACIGSAIAVILLGYIAFFKPSNGGTLRQDKEE